MSAHPLISIVIPTYQGAPWLRRGLAAIFEQTLRDQIEVIVIDSGSTDGTLEIVRAFPVRLHQIDKRDFNHGLTRNLGAQLARGAYVVMTVQDARPADERWLEKLLAGFTSENTAGVCGAQVAPHEPEINPIKWFRPQSEPGLVHHHFASPEAFDRLSPAEKKNRCGWDNVTAMYQREALLALPFREVSFAEDARWAVEALRAGYQLTYHTGARVYHYHHQTPGYTFRRKFTAVYHQYKLLGFVPPIPPRMDFQQGLSWANTLWRKSPGVSWRRKFFWLRHNGQIYWNSRRAVVHFHDLLSQGAEALDRAHEELCGEPPVSLATLHNTVTTPK